MPRGPLSLYTFAAYRVILENEILKTFLKTKLNKLNYFIRTILVCVSEENTM
jgi:hypothetical protein